MEWNQKKHLEKPSKKIESLVPYIIRERWRFIRTRSIDTGTPFRSNMMLNDLRMWCWCRLFNLPNNLIDGIWTSIKGATDYDVLDSRKDERGESRGSNSRKSGCFFKSDQHTSMWRGDPVPLCDIHLKNKTRLKKRKGNYSSSSSLSVEDPTRKSQLYRVRGINNNSGGNPPNQAPQSSQGNNAPQTIVHPHHFHHHHHHLHHHHGGGGGGVVVPPSAQQRITTAGGSITLAKPPVQVAIATAVKHHPLLEHHHLVPQPQVDAAGRTMATTTLRMPMTLPQSPVRATVLPLGPTPMRHLPQTPLPPTIHRGLRGLPKSLHSAVTNSATPTHCIMVNPHPASASRTAAAHLTMLPQAPTQGLIPTANASGLLSTTVGLIPIPRVQLQPNVSMAQLATHVPTALIPPPNSTSSNMIQMMSMILWILHPELLNRNKLNRMSSPKSRRKNQPMALQDHNYAYIPISPPTPPPPSPPPQPVIQTPQPVLSFNHSAPDFVGHETVASTTVCNSPRTAAGSPVVSRTQANLNSIQEAGVGPMVPLVGDDSAASLSSGDDKGEETETAPEAEDAEDDSITRCICDFLHDDGYMICCDKCSVWQHVVCMGLDRNNIPDEYLCEVCKPRQIDRKRAKSLQARRRTEIFKNSSSSDDEHNENKNSSLSNKRILNKRIVDVKKSGDSSKVSLKRQKLKKTTTSTTTPPADKELIKTTSTKKNYRKKKNSGSSLHHNNNTIKKITRRRVNSSYPDDEDDDEDDEEDEDFDTDDLEPKFETGQQLRSWIDQYEEAVTNHYSPELRARLSGHKNGTGELRSSVVNGPTRCTVSLQGNGVKILTANSNLSSNTPVVECKGRIMMASQYRASNKDQDYFNSPYVFFYRISEFLEIVVDGKTYGNDSRFCRRSSTNHNAELKHVVDKGSLHIFIVITKSLEKYQEILLPTEVRRLPRHNGISSSIQDDVREIRGKPNNVVEKVKGVTAMGKKKKRMRWNLLYHHLRLFEKGGKNEIQKEVRGKLLLVVKPCEETVAELKLMLQLRHMKMLTKRSKMRFRLNLTEKPLYLMSKKEEEVREKEDEDAIDLPKPSMIHNHDNNNESSGSNLISSIISSSSPPQKTSNPPKTSPNKLGLPDNSGLIIGVNTINYDASSSLKNKSKSREERKMEMIMKAIEAMEKAEQRKKETFPIECSSTPSLEKPPVKRRRSSSVKMTNPDSNLELSSADESKSTENQHASKKMKKKERKTSNTSTSPQRRRSRAMSGGGSADENPSSSSKDDVSANYLRGSRSPPGIATHLLRSAPLSPVKTVCSAKKRWLRQAISEDHSEDSPNGAKVKQEDETVTKDNQQLSVAAAALPSDAASDRNEEPELTPSHVPSSSFDVTSSQNITKENLSSEESKVPSALKKKLLQNLVLEAVLDSAMEDMLINVTSEDLSQDSVSKVKEEEEDKEEILQSNEKVLSTMLDVKLSPSDQKSMDEIKPSIKEEEINDIKHNKSTESEDPSPSTLNLDIKVEPDSNRDVDEADSFAQNNKDDQAALIKTPEPSSAFKSFFKSNVSIEDLEAELEETKRQRESSILIKDEMVAESSSPPSQKSSPTKDTSLPSSSSTSASTENASYSGEAINISSCSSKPKEKKRVSLADYKRRRKQGGSSTSAAAEILPSAVPSIVPATTVLAAAPPPPLSQIPSTQEPVSDEPGTPTLDEDQPITMPTLNTLPLFEKLEQLEKAQRENFVVVPSSMDALNSSAMTTSTTVNAERKREDLTERLKKEFGLVVEDNHEELLLKTASTPVVDGDATPETSSPQNTVPQSQPVVLVGGLNHHTPSRFSSFTPTQYPSYPSNYPLPPYPASKTAAAPHPPPSVAALGSTNNHQHHHHHSRRTSNSENYYSSAHSSSSSSRNYYNNNSSSSREA
ncbi:MLL5 [Lepeophtheirus salmonis]|uniref:MLL5 n=1 Tax=Lepeophtheirus salmonis TaxID=72036 RepID=A0A7R8D530_LEPSM|nr:MLL5 [Lepeophtheirus salmonis]CAF3030836.1 MLL5 [Lepeophtheirus salmonis]